MVGIPMGTNCAPLVADLFCSVMRQTSCCLFQMIQPKVIEAFNSTFQYLDGLMSIDNTFFDSIVNHIYPSELQLNKANVSDTEASFFGFTLSYIGWFCKD